MPGVLLRRSCAVVLVLASGSVVNAQELVYTAVTPCRVVDTRIPAPQPLAPGATRTFLFRGPTTNYSSQGGTAAGCGIPGLSNDGGEEQNTATAIAVNLIAVGPTGAGHLSAWPANQAPPEASVVNFSASTATGGLNVANGIILPLCDEVATTPCAAGDLSFVAGVSSTHLVVDVVGYFTTPGRLGARRYGTGADLDNGLCDSPVSGIRFGLSDTHVTWEGAAAACPRGTWVCSSAERGFDACNTTHFNGTCDHRTCAGACVDTLTDQISGWVADAGVSGQAIAVGEQGLFGAVVDTCQTMPVWCCSK